ncbi:Predicted DNA-binding transcriptional regulator YafY, contains an HTH and WYL domains [Proteiniborus ethanoligenes]|uniref:Predicted DNA-binding transcriptional regulator YafY, contains an HTH and WYL domains n=1 Tax=Proteiniborus ethanoligenes TaxID=415015 RepID=A0A1H3Q4R5_9FIRM|nr:YafY family protein [Proteiniborus ethanoligenes]SDZ08504.1 Predicted DNA-binding transcriptional regulator YafY, contains an HTH and WYL domains [Proteiniborus ethanoligenes]
MKKLERLVGIIYALKQNKRLTAKEIGDIFEVSERTIYRDIEALCQMNVPIIALQGFSGGYEINESYFVPTIAFLENEVLYLLICLKLGEIIKVPNMKEDYESLKYKLLNILDEDKKERYLDLLSRIILGINKIYPENYKPDVTKKIIESFFEYRDLTIEYYNPKKDECIERMITPYTLSFYSGGWYIEAYCHLRKSKRLFRIDRIKSIGISEKVHPKSFIDEYLKNVDRKKDTKEVNLEMDRFLYETVKNDRMFIHAEKKLKEDKVRLKFYTDDMDEVINLAFQNYQEIRIIEPKSCIHILKTMCKEILDKY